MKSDLYSVKIKQQDDFIDSYVYEYEKNNGSNATINDPYNISNPGKVNALTNSNHWTCFSFDGNPVTLEISRLSGDISECKIFPGRYGLEATYSDGKAFVTIPSPNKKIYFEIDGNIKEPLFVFADEPEKDIPDESDENVLYFKPGIHDIGVKYTPDPNIETVYIAGGAYVKGSIYTNNRKNFTVKGRGIISGEGIKFNILGNATSHIYFDGNNTEDCAIEGITIIKPIKYHVLSRGHFDVDNIKCFSWNNTTDGWGGGYGSGNPCTCTNSFFKVNDDVFKIYGNNFKIHDNVVYHQTNGHVFQFGWGGQKARNADVKRTDIVRTSETEPSYPSSEGHPLIGWARANSGTYQTGHNFEDITAENGLSRIFDISNGGTTSIECEDFVIEKTIKQSILPSAVDIEMKCIFVHNRCVDESEFNNPNGISINCNDCDNIPAKIYNLNDSGIKLFPNPTKGDITIVNPNNGKLRIEIIRTDGRMIQKFEVVNKKTILPLSSIPRGLYYFKILGKNVKGQQKVLLQ